MRERPTAQRASSKPRIERARPQMGAHRRASLWGERARDARHILCVGSFVRRFLPWFVPWVPWFVPSFVAGAPHGAGTRPAPRRAVMRRTAAEPTCEALRRAFAGDGGRALARERTRCCAKLRAF